MNLTFKLRSSSIRSGFFLFLKLLILLCLVKLCFILFNPGLVKSSNFRWLKITGWSLLYDAIIIILFLLPALIFPATVRNQAIRYTYSAILSFIVLLNIADVFYFPFHHQRANADLLYVVSGVDGAGKHILLLILALIAIGVIVWIVNRWLKVFSGNAESSLVFLLFPFLLLLLPKGMLLPSYPLTDLRSHELVIAQNSFHTFAYSLFRKKESSLFPFEFMADTQAAALFSNNTKVESREEKRNVMLFIMESVPVDFFIDGPYKTRLPFFDSLIARSTWFENAYSYSHNSNKGISAILASLPTLTDIPLYHSGFSSLKKTDIGDILSQAGYETSFFIGDRYDGFGFAKFCNWTGIKNYYSKEDIIVPKGTDQHTLGLHDEQVASFSVQKLKAGNQPFFSVFYNLSTHYPNDLPENFRKDPSLTTPMNAMRYYDRVVNNFFRSIEREAWFKNTVFIFCSDHWMFPDHRSEAMNPVSSFRIPIIIYDPMQDSAVTNKNVVSQLDILPTVLSYSGQDSTYIAYGKPLYKQDSNRVVFARENNMLYQAFNKEYVLGMNVFNGRTEFMYRIYDISNNLTGKGLPAEDSLRKSLQSFLQLSANHYRGKLTY